MTDGYKYIDVFYHLQTPSFRVELIVPEITGRVVFSTLFYSDPQHTEYLGESTIQSVNLGTNLFETGSLQYGNMSLYVIGRIKIVQGSSLTLSAIKINNINHIESGSLSATIPPLYFVESALIEAVFHSVKLGLILDPAFKIELQVQFMERPSVMEYLYYTDDTYTQLSSTQTVELAQGTNILQVQQTNKYVMFQIKMNHGSHLVLSSFKLQQVEQPRLLFTTPEYIADVSIVSETCFPANTLVTTDQGVMAIQKVKPHYHTIQGKSVIALTSTYSSDKELVLVRKDAIRRHYPSRDTLMSKKHKIYMKGKLKAAYRLAENYKGVSLVPYRGQMLFNLLLEDYGLMNIQGMLCETLHPINPMATLFRNMYKQDAFLLQ